MTAAPFRMLAIAIVGLGLFALGAQADEVPQAKTPKSKTPQSYVKPPSLNPGTGDLLPFNDLEREDFYAKHGVLVYRLKSLDDKVQKLAKQQAKKGLPAAERTKLQKEIRRLRIQTTALRHRLTEAVMDSGVDGKLIAYMNHAPKGAGRLERYSHGLVLLLDDLDAEQRGIFERVVAQVDGAYAALTAQKERTLLALKQSKLDKDEVRAVGGTFDRQMRIVDQRLWMLVDLLLTREQKVSIWRSLPQRMKRKSQAVEHLYQLPGLTPSQATRLKSALTEMEQEASPDQAAVKRIQAQLRNRKLPKADRDRLGKERSAAYKRLSELRRFATDATRSILSEEQWQEYLSIPPRLSTNDRSGSYNRILQGFKPTAAQNAKMKALQQELREERRATALRMRELRRQSADYGPDSPQMMSMQMMMAGAKGEGAASGRAYLRGMFAQVLTPDEVTRWVMGHWGYKQ
jgi:hypothetical protein